MITKTSTPLKFFLSITLLIFTSQLSAQTPLTINDSTSVPTSTLFEPDSMVQVAYDTYPKRMITSAIATVSVEGFNQGLISDPALLIQGKVPGVQIYNRGADPNLLSLIRIRGLSSFSQRSLLFVIDGVPGASIQNLDPNDIASITILKDGSAQAIYGIRASNGVIMVQTKDGLKAKDKISISYNGQAAISTAYPGIAVMSAEEYRTTGGLITDFGASTNWLEEVSQQGFSNAHNLALKGSLGNTSYRVSGNYRNVEGVLQKSGFEQLNTRAKLNTSLFKEALSIQLSASYSDRTSQLGFNEAFRYAISMNPTAPIFGQDAPYPYNAEEYGGFFETLGLFDSFNPKAIVDLNDRNGKLQVLTTSALMKLQIQPDLSLNFRYTYQDQFSNERAFYSQQSYFRGNPFYFGPERNGRADLSDYSDDFSLYEIFATHTKSFGKSKLGLNIGYSYQDGNHLDNHLQLLGFSNEGVLEENKIEDYQSWMNEAQLFDTINNGWTDNLAAFFGRANFNFKNKLMLNASLRYEGSSKLGEEGQWGLFPAFGLALDFDEMWNISSFDQLKFRAGYGVTGSVPQSGGLSQPKINRILQDNGTFFDRVIWDANPNLKWEEKSEVNLGLDFKLGKLEGYIDWYTRTVKDWIERVNADVFPIYTNQNAFKSTGIDINLGLNLYESQEVTYHTGFLLSFYQTEYTALSVDEGYALGVGGFVQNPPIGIKEGAPIGDIYGLIFETADIIGNPVFEDINRDGFVNTDIYGIFEPESDFQVIGNGLPTFELGWNSHLQFNGWHIQAFFRGAFGHSLVNRNRLFYETILSIRNNYNLVDTELAEDGLRRGIFSSLHVEKANFLKLDNLTISRSFPFGTTTKQKRLKIALTGQNLFTITNYTGADPEPVLEDPGNTFDGNRQLPIDNRNPLGPGVDRRNNYLPFRTIVLGLGLEF